MASSRLASSRLAGAHLFDVDYIRRIFGARVDYFGAARDLQRLLLLHHLLVGGQVPQAGRAQAGVRLLDPRELLHFLGGSFDVVLRRLDVLGVRPNPLPAHKEHSHPSSAALGSTAGESAGRT